MRHRKNYISPWKLSIPCQKSLIHLQKPDFACSVMFSYHFNMVTYTVTSSKPPKWILQSKENIFDTLTALVWLIEKKLWVLENHHFCKKWVHPPTWTRETTFHFFVKKIFFSIFILTYQLLVFFEKKFSLTFQEENFHWLFKKKIFIDFLRRKFSLTF